MSKTSAPQAQIKYIIKYVKEENFEVSLTVDSFVRTMRKMGDCTKT